MVNAVDALDDVQSFGMGKAYVIQPRDVIETGRIDNQGVAFPLADRIAIVGKAVELLGMSPIQMDLPQLVAGLLIHEDLPRNLKYLYGERDEHNPGHTVRQARQIRVVNLGVSKLKSSFSPRREGCVS